MEEEVNKYVKAKDVALTQAFMALFGVFMETLKFCILLGILTVMMTTTTMRTMRTTTMMMMMK